jgi:hypothetical protein
VLLMVVQDAADPVCGLQPLAGDRLSLYIELNVAFKLTVEDAELVPQAEVKVRAAVPAANHSIVSAWTAAVPTICSAAAGQDRACAIQAVGLCQKSPKSTHVCWVEKALPPLQELLTKLAAMLCKSPFIYS